MNNKTNSNFTLPTIIFAAFVIFTILLVAGCTTSAVFWDDHRAYPKKPHFSIIPREYSAEELVSAGIRTDGVYLDIGWRPQELQEREEAWMREKGWGFGSSFYRFWSNGRLMARADNIDPSLLSATHADSFLRGRMGYYRILSDKSIEVEIYTYDSGRWDYTYSKSRKKIEDDTFWSDHGYRKFKGQSVHVELGYQFMPIPGMKAQPDW